MSRDIFDEAFTEHVRALVSAHHGIYPRIPPQGIFFEELVRKAFVDLGWKSANVVPTKPNSPQHDLLVGDQRLAIKTETGRGTNADFITITKVCTTEREPWQAEVLVERVLQHLARYNRMLMLRAIWGQHHFSYQLLEIPLPTLEQMKGSAFAPTGRRTGRRQSLAAIVYEQAEPLFNVFFDGSDGKCVVRRLPVSRCRTLRTWRHPVPTRIS